MIRRVILSLVVLSLLVPALASAQVFVQGYYRRDGTYVPPHYRTAPDGNPYNNFSPPAYADPSIYQFLHPRGVTPINPNAFADGVRAGQEMRLRQLQIELLQRQLHGR